MRRLAGHRHPHATASRELRRTVISLGTIHPASLVDGGLIFGRTPENPWPLVCQRMYLEALVDLAVTHRRTVVATLSHLGTLSPSTVARLLAAQQRRPAALTLRRQPASRLVLDALVGVLLLSPYLGPYLGPSVPVPSLGALLGDLVRTVPGPGDRGSDYWDLLWSTWPTLAELLDWTQHGWPDDDSLRVLCALRNASEEHAAC